METNLITHIYNEEYLLPFWLEHHKNMFDNIIVIDYRSTDKSVEICKTICPKCKVITTRNEFFDGIVIDSEVMDIENDLTGIKIALNTTEFLFYKTPIKEKFSNFNESTSLAIPSYAAHSSNKYEDIKDYKQYMNSLLNEDVVYHLNKDRGLRQIHTFKNGNYTIGRHSTENPSIPAEDIFIIWVGFFPLNDVTLKRKLQIKKNISEEDKRNGKGFQHFYDEERILNINKDNVDKGVPLKKTHYELYKLVKEKIDSLEESFELYCANDASIFVFLLCVFLILLLICITDTMFMTITTKTFLMYIKKFKNLYNNYI